jgi:PAS domain S-box-containing protein
VGVCAAAPGLLAYMVLLCWVLGNGKLTAVGCNYVPMYALTALLMILLSFGVMFHWCWPSQPIARRLALFFVALVEVASLLVLSQFLLGFHPPFLRSLTLAAACAGDIPSGPMSPLTAAAFVCAGLALFCQLPPWGRRWKCRQAAAALALATWSLSLVVLLFYVAGMPLLYGVGSVPMSVLTAVSFAFLSSAILLAAGPDTLPLSLFRGAPEAASRPSQYGFFGTPLLAFAFLVAGIGAVSYTYFTRQVASARETAQLTMSAIADLKMRQILKWRQERLGCARMIMEESHLRRDLHEWFAGAAATDARPGLLEWLKAVCEHNEGLRILLLDRQMNVRLAYPEDKTYFGPTAHSYALLALRSNDVVMSDLHRSRFSGEIHLDLAIPLRPSSRASPGTGASSGRGSRAPLGMLVVEVDPGKFLYPQIQDWPTPSPTAETLLARREGDEVVFLNELRHQRGTALSLRLPKNHPLDPHLGQNAGQTASCTACHGPRNGPAPLSPAHSRAGAMPIVAASPRGQGGVMEGIDYRGHAVLAATRVIPGTPWFVVAKVDQDEVYAPLRERGLATMAFTIAMVVVAALVVGLLGRRRDTRWLRSQLAVEREHRLILDSTDQGVLGLDLQGRHVFVNPAACRMLGYELHELIGKPSHALWHHTRADGSPYPTHACPVYEALQTGASCSADEDLFWRKDGTSFPAEYTATPSREKDRPVALVLFFRDVTERHRTENALRTQKEAISRERANLQTIFDAVPVGMLLVDENTRVTRVNDVLAQLVGKQTSDLLGRQPGDGLCCVHAGAVPAGCGHAAACPDCPVREAVQHVLDDGKEIRNAELTMRLMIAGEQRQPCFAASAAPLTLDGKKHALLALIDISERKQAEAGLRESEERLNKVVAAAQDAIIMLDPEGRISMWNQAAVRIFGYQPEEALGQNLHRLMAPGRFHAEHFREFDAFRGSGAGKVVGQITEFTALRKGGEEFPIELSLSSVCLQGQWHSIGVLRDITGRKQIELQQAQYALAVEGQRLAMEQLYGAAEVANRAKSEFLANMSHEIRTPMTAILGYVDVLTAQLKDREHRDALNIIRRNGDHLLTIINDILDLSKIEAGRLHVERCPCSPAALVAEVLSLMRVRAGGKGLELKLEFAGPVPETVSTDPARLRQILLNLVGNAIKFTEIGGVRIAVRLLGGDTSQPKLLFEVVDTGIGITAEQVGQLFKPFRQADASTSRKFGGTGLGLAISKRLAEFLGGDIAVRSEFNKGSSFALTIDPGPLAGVAFLDQPSEAVKTPAATSANAPSQPCLNCRILLAEDGADNQRFISFLLTKAGAEVTTVDNGQKALEMALATFSGWGRRLDDPREPFDVILMDMQMPVMDGYEATRRLRQEGYHRPIIALTAHAMAEDRQKCLDAGCDEYATKPIDRAALFNTIAIVLERNRDTRRTSSQPGPLTASGEPL